MYLPTKQPHALRIRALACADRQGRLWVSDNIDYVREGGTDWGGGSSHGGHMAVERRYSKGTIRFWKNVLNTDHRRKTDIYSRNEQKYPGCFPNHETFSMATRQSSLKYYVNMHLSSVPLFKKMNAVP
jgi:hypothetical protein